MRRPWNMTKQQYHTNSADSESSSIDYEKAQRATRLLLEALGEDPDRDGLKETWQRRIPSAFETLTAGQREDEKLSTNTIWRRGE